MYRNLTKILFLILFVNSLEAQISLNDGGSSSSNSILTLQQISVTIGGEFIVNGTFPASSTERVDHFLSRLYNEAKVRSISSVSEVYQKQLLEEEFAKFAWRGIKLIRVSGDEIFLDLAKFRLTGDFKYNPYLKNDDVIVFPALDLSRNFIEITGAVNKIELENKFEPFRFQFLEGDKLSDAIQFAQGINLAYENVKFAEISRLNYNGLSEEIILVNISDDTNLHAGDRIRILADDTQKKNFKILIEGEVNQPGYVYITKDNTTIKEIIEKVGGFKLGADLDRAELIRGANIYNSPIFSERFETIMMQRMANIEIEDSLSFLVDNELRYSRGNLSIDFKNILDSNSLDSKFIVKDRDYIFVPEKVNLVYVFGQVASPGYIEFVDGKNIDYYIEKAGGIGKTAKGEIYLIEGTTRSWIEIDEDVSYDIKPGDYIWLPKEPHRSFNYYLNQIGSIAGIVGGVATVIVLLLQLKK
ncbi:MAG: SLBB domain-containing protein [Ignavibacteriae bacterium]|nr:SLBB domain-containing protein [Ignavibacteriota bacterium]